MRERWSHLPNRPLQLVLVELHVLPALLRDAVHPLGLPQWLPLDPRTRAGAAVGRVGQVGHDRPLLPVQPAGRRAVDRQGGAAHRGGGGVGLVGRPGRLQRGRGLLGEAVGVDQLAELAGALGGNGELKLDCVA